MRFLLFFLFGPVLIFCQDTIIGPDAFLAITMSAYEDMGNRSGTPGKIHFPLIEKLDFRSETHEFLPDEQEYLFRVSPGTFEKRRALKKMYRAFQQKPDFETHDFLCDLSYELQKEWLILWYKKAKRNLHQRKLQAIQQTDSLIMEGLLKAEPLKMIKARNDATDLSLRIKNLDIEIQKIKVFYGINDIKTDFSGLKSPEELIDYLRTQQDETVNSSLAKIDYDLMINELELNLEKAESKQFLDFFQLRYQGPSEDLLTERIQLGVGFIIPNSGNRKLDIKELEIEAAELIREKEIEEIEIERNKTRSMMSILASHEILKHNEEVLANESQELTQLQDDLKNNEFFDVEILLHIQERIQENKMEILDSKFELYRKILEYAQDFEMICHDVTVSFLF